LFELLKPIGATCFGGKHSDCWSDAAQLLDGSAAIAPALSICSVDKIVGNVSWQVRWVIF
jgi:hypothetical protein